MKDEEDLNELFQALKNEGSRTEGPGPIQNVNQQEIHPPEDDDSENEEDQMDKPQPLVSKPGWKHGSSNPLLNPISPPNSGI